MFFIHLTNYLILPTFDRSDAFPREKEKEKENIIWRIRDTDEFFAKPKPKPESESKESEQKPPSEKKQFTKKDTAPFVSWFCTGGRIIKGASAGNLKDFVVVMKQTSVSISERVFLLATAMCDDSETQATVMIRDLAVEAWNRDLARAESLYGAIVNAENQILSDREIPDKFKASAAVSQEVEYLVHNKICRWLGRDPDKPFSRKRGRHGKRGKKGSGQYIELESLGDTVTGRTIVAIGGFPADTDLAELSLKELVTILGELQDLEASDDIDLLVAFLDLLDSDWRVNALAEEPETDRQNPYEILGIEESASPKEIKQAYRELSLKVHPDTSKLPDWIFQQVKAAYDSLL